MTSPAAQSSAQSPSIAFHCSGDESGLWQRDLRAEAPQILSFQHRQTLPALEGPWGPGQPCPGVCPAPSAPRVFVKQSHRFSACFGTSQLLSAPEHICPGFHTGGFSSPSRVSSSSWPCISGTNPLKPPGTGAGLWDNTHSTPRRSPGLLWLPCGGAFQEGLLFADFRFNSLALH